MIIYLQSQHRNQHTHIKLYYKMGTSAAIAAAAAAQMGSSAAMAATAAQKVVI
jgi:hypothetical protein